jgi:acrylyl-CoA reductase (NADPH)
MFKALLLTQHNKTTQADFVSLEETALPAGDVLVDVAWSALNYKDALAITGKGAIVRRWPLVPGIDLAGTVARSEHPDWTAGDPVVINGWGLGETHWGGLAQKARVSSDWLLRLPEGFSLRDSMVVGTAGYTAALCVMALLKHGLTPASGEVLVTGAAGGVGSIAVALLASLGFTVSASTGRAQEADYLRQLGASHIVDRNDLSAPGKALQTERWAGGVDAVGSHTLVNALAATRWNGAVAACGLAQGADLPGTVMPFILRGITLYGINCVMVDNHKRREAWALLARHLKPELMAQMTVEVGLSQVVAASQDLLSGKIRGRTVVDISR